MHHDQVIDIDRKDGVIVVAINDGVVSVDANVSSSNGITVRIRFVQSRDYLPTPGSEKGPRIGKRAKRSESSAEAGHHRKGLRTKAQIPNQSLGDKAIGSSVRHLRIKKHAAHR